MLGIITKVDQKDGIYHIKFSKSMDVPEEQRRPLRLPPNWKKTKQLKKSFTYPFPSIGIYKKIRLATQQEINRTRSKIERTKRRESSSRKRKLRQRRDEVNTPRMKRDVQKAISILDDAIQGFDRNSLQELSDEVRELDDEIHQLLSDIEKLRVKGEYIQKWDFTDTICNNIKLTIAKIEIIHLTPSEIRKL